MRVLVRAPLFIDLFSLNILTFAIVCNIYIYIYIYLYRYDLVKYLRKAAFISYMRCMSCL